MIKHLQITYRGYLCFGFLHTTQNWKGEKHKLSSSSSSLQMELLSSNLELHPQPADEIFWLQSSDAPTNSSLQMEIFGFQSSEVHP
jgi:hypothetical protein